jgi:autotransporter-associated beta strand protein
MSGTPANWGGTTPTGTDTARWNAASYTNAPSANANMPIGQLLFDAGNTAGVTFGTGANTLTLNGLGSPLVGIDMVSGSGAVNTGSAKFALGASQIWQNNSSSLLSGAGTINLGTFALTVDGTGNITRTGIISNGSIIKNGTGTLSINAANTFAGGLTINNGTVSGNNAASFGGAGGVISLGDTTASNTNNATLIAAHSNTVANNITVNAGSSGTLKISTNPGSSNQGPTFSGTVALNKDLTIDNQCIGGSATTIKLTNTITGTSSRTITLTSATNAIGTTYGTAITADNSASFAGNIVVQGGMLSFGNNSLGSGGAGSLQFTGNATLQWNGTNTQDISAKQLNPGSSSNTLTLNLLTNNVAFATTNGLTGSGTITKANTTGVLTLSAANNFSGIFNTGTTANGVVIGHSAALQSATVNQGVANAVNFGTGITAATFGALTGNFALALTNADTNPVALTVGGNGGNSTNTALISGAGSITQNGAGILQLGSGGAGTVVSTFSGGLNLLAGSLDYKGSATPGSDVQTGGGSLVGGHWGIGTVTLGNGTATDVTLTNSTGSGARTFSNNVVFAGDVTVGGPGPQSIIFNMFTDGATIIAGDALTTPNKITLTRTNELTINNAMSFFGEVQQSGGTYGITKLGTSTLTLGGGESVANTFSGDVTVTAGQVTLAKAANTDAIGGSLLINGGTVFVNASEQIPNTATISMSSGIFQLNGSGVGETVAGLTVTGGKLTGSGGSLPLVIAGAGVASISNNTLDGSGTTNFKLTTGTGGLILGDGGKSESTVTLNGNVAYTGTTTASQLKTVNLGGATRTFTVADVVANANDLTVTGVISNGGLTKAGAGTLLLSGANTYTDATTVNQGTLQVGVAGAIPNGSGKGNVVFDTAANTAIFDINGFDTTINGLTQASASTTNKVVNNAVGTSKTMTVGGNDATSTFAGIIADNTGTGGTLALAKTGTGTLTLSGANTYTGATTVNGGTLKVTGSIKSIADVNVLAAATLRLESGTSPALGLGAGGVDIVNNGFLEIASTQAVGDISGGTGSKTTVSGTSTSLTANSIVQDTLDIGAGCSVTIREAAVLPGAGGAGASPVPEPGTWVLIGVGLLSLLAFRRRR